MRRPLLVPSLFALSIALPRSARAELPPLPAEGAPVATSSTATAQAEAPAAPPTRSRPCSSKNGEPGAGADALIWEAGEIAKASASAACATDRV